MINSDILRTEFAKFCIKYNKYITIHYISGDSQEVILWYVDKKGNHKIGFIVDIPRSKVEFHYSYRKHYSHEAVPVNSIDDIISMCCVKLKLVPEYKRYTEINNILNNV